MKPRITFCSHLMRWLCIDGPLICVGETWQEAWALWKRSQGRRA
jgi:hypothetical protein